MLHQLPASEEEDARGDRPAGRGRPAARPSGARRHPRRGASARQIIDTAVARARRPRHPGQQRGLPDGPAGRHRRHHHRAVRPGDEDQPVRDVLAVQEGACRTWSRAPTIINTSSVQASSPSPELLDYATTQGRHPQLHQGAGPDLAEQGIRVNAVAPGPIWTPLIPATMPEEQGREPRRETPLGRAGPAGRGRAGLRLPRVPGVQLHHGEMLAVTGGQPVT